MATACLVMLSIGAVPVLARDQRFEYDEDLARLCVVRCVVESFASTSDVSHLISTATCSPVSAGRRSHRTLLSVTGIARGTPLASTSPQFVVKNNSSILLSLGDKTSTTFPCDGPQRNTGAPPKRLAGCPAVLGNSDNCSTRSSGLMGAHEVVAAPTHLYRTVRRYVERRGMGLNPHSTHRSHVSSGVSTGLSPIFERCRSWEITRAPALTRRIRGVVPFRLAPLFPGQLKLTASRQTFFQAESVNLGCDGVLL